MRVAEIADEIHAAGAEIVWVLEADLNVTPGTADSCYEFIRQESTSGWCVGDGETMPDEGEWDDSPFSQGRGFDIIVPRSTMTIEFTTNFGTPSGNDNPTAAEVLQAIEDVVAAL